MEELFDIYDEAGNPCGTAPRSRCHGDPSLIHRVVHVVLFDPEGSRVLLQKRARTKRIQPGKWDTAVGGHISAGETPETAVRREMKEELGIEVPCVFWFDARIRNEIESENVLIYRASSGGPFAFARDEMDEVRFFPLAELPRMMEEAPEQFTPFLRYELTQVRERLRRGE